MKAKLIRALESTLSNDSVFNKERIPYENFVQTVRDKKFWINLTSPVMMKGYEGYNFDVQFLEARKPFV